MPVISPSRPVPSPRWHAVAIFGATILVYLNSFGNAFVWDDQYLVVDHAQIKRWTKLPELFVSDLFPRVMPSGYYRPIQALTNMLDYHLWGLRPFGYHLTNTLLHALVALLFYRLVVLLLRDARAALFAALLFAVHPVHTEAVTYISGRSDPLAAVFMLASLLGFLAARSTGLTRWRAASLLAFVLALLSREAAVGLVLLISLVDLAVASRDGSCAGAGRRALGYLSYLVVLFGYLTLRALVVGITPVPTPTAEIPLLLRLLTLPKVVVQYLALLIVPVDQHMERLVPPAESLFDPLTTGALLVVFALVVGAALARRAAWPVTFGAAWFFVALLPVANVVPLATFMAEHWLYVPSMGLFLAAGWGLSRLAADGWQQPVATAVIVMLAAYGSLTIRRNSDWKDGVTLYEATVRLAPHSARAWANLATTYLELGRVEQAREAQQKALERMVAEPNTDMESPTLPDQPGPRVRLAQHHGLVGNIYRQQGRHEEAAREFRRAVALDPNQVSAYNNLGLTLEALGQGDEGRQAFETALLLDPEFAAAHSNLGNHYFRRGEFERARVEYQESIRLNPDYAEAYNNLGSVHFRMGRPDLAEAAYRTALRLNPQLDPARQNLAVVLQARKPPTPGEATPVN